VELAADGAPDGWGRRLLIRRSLSTGELAFYRCAGPAPLPLVTMARVAGCRWRIEEDFQATKGLCGLDEHRVRRWRSWYRHLARSPTGLAEPGRRAVPQGHGRPRVGDRPPAHPPPAAPPLAPPRTRRRATAAGSHREAPRGFAGLTHRRARVGGRIYGPRCLRRHSESELVATQGGAAALGVLILDVPDERADVTLVVGLLTMSLIGEPHQRLAEHRAASKPEGRSGPPLGLVRLGSPDATSVATLRVHRRGAARQQ
jgi:hypothetical protein